MEQITFKNINTVLYYLSILQPKKQDDGYIFQQKNPKLFKFSVKNIMKTLKIKNRLITLKQYITVFNRLVEYYDIEEILNITSEDEKENEENKEKIEYENKRKMFEKNFINGYYKHFLYYKYISYQEFEKIKFLDYMEIIQQFQLKEIHDQFKMIESISTGFAGGESAEKVINRLKEDEKKAREINFDKKGFLKYMEVDFG